MYKYTHKDLEKDPAKKVDLLCSVCGEGVERSHSFKKVTCFSCKKERKTVYNQELLKRKNAILLNESD